MMGDNTLTLTGDCQICLPAYFDAAEAGDKYNENEQWTGDNGQLHQDRVSCEVIVVTHRVPANQRYASLVRQLACQSRVVQ